MGEEHPYRQRDRPGGGRKGVRAMMWRTKKKKETWKESGNNGEERGENKEQGECKKGRKRNKSEGSETGRDSEKEN